MEVTIISKIDTKAKKKLHNVHEIGSLLTFYFKEKDYGKDLLMYLIGFKCSNPPLGFEKFAKSEKPVYIDHKISKNRFSGATITTNKLFINGFNFSPEEYDVFVNSSDQICKVLLAKKIIDSLSNLDKLPKKCKDFDKEQFKKDMITLFVEKGLYEENENNLTILI